jgi:hypothetical protein
MICGEKFLEFFSDLFLRQSLLSSRQIKFSDLDRLVLRLHWLGNDVNEHDTLLERNESYLLIYF